MTDIVQKATPSKLLLISLFSAALLVFPNLTWMSWELSFLPESKHTAYFAFIIFRYLFFVSTIWFFLWYNIHRMGSVLFKKRLFHTFLGTFVFYLLYSGCSFLFGNLAHCSATSLIVQFLAIATVSSVAGHVFFLYVEQGKKELEIEQLKVENLQSRCDALTNQINPHFFFNSLNGLSALVRKKDDEKTQEYVNKLSDVFRYILQSDKKGLVTLREELAFVESFRYMMEVRFANKLVFHIEIEEADMDLKIPVLSILPLIDNVVMHNTIDSEHIMEVSIRLNEQKELIVSNPIFPKREAADTNGTGIRNLENRFTLLMEKQIRIENDKKTFRVYLPLK